MMRRNTREKETRTHDPILLRVPSCPLANPGQFNQLADTLAVPTYFADPYSAWQRGTNEHFNGRIRKYLPKGTSFTDLDQQELDEYVTEINNRPRKVLGWATPAEVSQELTLT